MSDITPDSWIAAGLGLAASPYVNVGEEARRLYEHSLAAIFSDMNADKTVGELREQLLENVSPAVLRRFREMFL